MSCVESLLEWGELNSPREAEPFLPSMDPSCKKWFQNGPGKRFMKGPSKGGTVGNRAAANLKGSFLQRFPHPVKSCKIFP
jgi:hypothetical protein